MDLFPSAQEQLAAHLREIDRLKSIRDRAWASLIARNGDQADAALDHVRVIAEINDRIDEHTKQAKACRTAIRLGL